MADSNQPPAKRDSSWGASIRDSLKTQTATWLVGAVIGLLTLFSSRITDSIKTAINRADERPKYYEEIATELSDFVFLAELNVEYIERGWTEEKSLAPLIQQYNDAITKLRRKEYVYLSWVGRYWGDEQVRTYNSLADAIKEFDSSVHGLNDEFEQVNIDKSKNKIDAARAKQELGRMKPALSRLQQLTRALLGGLR